jgi:hypothetical protein
LVIVRQSAKLRPTMGIIVVIVVIIVDQANAIFHDGGIIAQSSGRTE